jgi:hypothetical protein
VLEVLGPTLRPTFFERRQLIAIASEPDQFIVYDSYPGTWRLCETSALDISRMLVHIKWVGWEFDSLETVRMDSWRLQPLLTLLPEAHDVLKLNGSCARSNAVEVGLIGPKSG